MTKKDVSRFVACVKKKNLRPVESETRALNDIGIRTQCIFKSEAAMAHVRRFWSEKKHEKKNFELIHLSGKQKQVVKKKF